MLSLVFRLVVMTAFAAFVINEQVRAHACMHTCARACIICPQLPACPVAPAITPVHRSARLILTEHGGR